MTRNWKPSFCSMDPQLDEDHQTLFKLLDRVATLRRESDLEELNPFLDQLLTFTFDHFAREERVMETTEYPRFARHTEEHLAMREALIEALRKVAKGTLAIPAFIRHLKESFTYHFETDDMTFVTWHLQNRGQEPRRAPRIPAGV